MGAGALEWRELLKRRMIQLVYRYVAFSEWVMCAKLNEQGRPWIALIISLGLPFCCRPSGNPTARLHGT